MTDDKEDPMENIRKRLRDIYSEIEAIDKTININQTKPSDFSIEGEAVKSMHWQPSYDPFHRQSTVDPSYLNALRKGQHFEISGTLDVDDKTIEKFKRLAGYQGIRFILDVASFDEYCVSKKNGKITYTLTFDEDAVPVNTSDAAGLVGISSLADRWAYDSITVDVSPDEFYARLENLRKKN